LTDLWISGAGLKSGIFGDIYDPTESQALTLAASLAKQADTPVASRFGFASSTKDQESRIQLYWQTEFELTLLAMG
jgi:triphosphoribosyl-dephospho-CoA synthetase